MICPKCNEMLPDDSTFCTKCGAAIETPAAADVTAPQIPPMDFSAFPPVKIKKNKMPLIGMILGAVFILWGLIGLLGTQCGVSPTSFGGDFYTFCYRGIVEAAELVAVAAKAIYTLVMAFGAFMVCYFGNKQG